MTMTREHTFLVTATTSAMGFGFWQNNFWAGLFIWGLLMLAIFLKDWEK